MRPWSRWPCEAEGLWNLLVSRATPCRSLAMNLRLFVPLYPCSPSSCALPCRPLGGLERVI